MSEEAKDPKELSFEELSDHVIGAIAEVKDISPDEVTLDSTFEELEVDSLDAMEMLFLMEEKLDINMPDQAARAMENVRQVVDAVDKLLKGEELDLPEPAAAEAPSTVDDESKKEAG